LLGPAIAGCQDAANLFLYETHTITAGSFRGLEIGSAKETTLDAIARLGAFAVKPRPSADFSVSRDNIGDLGRVASAEGIRVTDYRGLAIDVFFQHGAVLLIRKSVPAKENTWFSQGDAVAEVQKKLASLLVTENLSVFPIVYFEGNGWVELAKRGENIPASLGSHAAWTFEISTEKPGGAFVDVYFDGNRLSRIEYRRPRIRL